MPPDGTPHINQETDTRARSGSGHDPQRRSQHHTHLRPRTVQSNPVTTDGTPPPACPFHPSYRRPEPPQPRANPSPPPISSRASRHAVAHLFLTWLLGSSLPSLEPPVVDELQPLVMRSCGLAPETDVTCLFCSQQFSSLHAAFGAHVPSMCPDPAVRGLFVPNFRHGPAHRQTVQPSAYAEVCPRQP